MQLHISCQAKATCTPHTRASARLFRGSLLVPTAHQKQQRRRLSIACTAEAPSQDSSAAGSAPAAATPPNPPTPAAAAAPAAPKDLTADWEKAIEHYKNCDTLSGKVVRTNQAGVNIKIGNLIGFIPYKLLAPSRLPEGARQFKPPHPAEGYKALMGKSIKFKITQINVPERRLVCSERAVMLDDLAASVKPGDVLQGRVTALRDFGAFVEVKKEGEEGDAYGPEVLLPLREISWDWIPNTAAALQVGQELTCVVTNLHPPPKTKVYVSLKRLQEDPLKQTLDKVMPLDGVAVGVVPTSVPSGVEDILDELSKEEGIQEVSLGRQADVQHTVSQDLELWLTKEEVAGGFNLVARAGRVVQEIHVTTQLSKDDMKATVQRVLSRLV